MKRTAFKAQTTRPKCKACKQPFTMMRPMQVVCSGQCGAVVAAEKRQKAEEKQKADERKADKAKKEALKPRSYWEKKAEEQVNRYVRVRDASLGCISCDKPASWGGQWHASHFRSVGAASAVRFNLWNINKACSQCNKWLSGNIAEYEPRLRARLGYERVDWLKTQNQIVRYPIEYLKRMKSIFNRKANRLAKRQENSCSTQTTRTK